MTNKNPFEIRTEVLQLAKQFMDEYTQNNINYAQKMMELGLLSTTEVLTLMKPYSMEDLMAKAQEMYSFVLTKDKKE
jgi:hypothetical protein